MARKKTYRFKDPVKHVKSAVGEFQTKHPFLALMVEVPIIAGIGAGVIQGTTPINIFDITRGFKKIPITGRLYTEFANGVVGLF